MVSVLSSYEVKVFHMIIILEFPFCEMPACILTQEFLSNTVLTIIRCWIGILTPLWEKCTLSRKLFDSMNPFNTLCSRNK